MADIDVVSHVDISTHTSRVGCDLVIRHAVDVRNISTHTSRVGCDEWGYIMVTLLTKFLLTHPVWDVTVPLKKTTSPTCISTHTSRVGCDFLESFHKWLVLISTHTSRVGCDIPLAVTGSPK